MVWLTSSLFAETDYFPAPATCSFQSVMAHKVPKGMTGTLSQQLTAYFDRDNIKLMGLQWGEGWRLESQQS